jgi:F-type H+-transporting ATPase subunit a
VANFISLSEVTCKFGDEACPFPAPGAAIFEWRPMASIDLFGFTSLDITKPVVLAMICSVLVSVVFLMAFAKPKLVPTGLQNVVEVGYLFIRDNIAREIMGKDGDRFVALLTSLFFFVWTMNIMAIIPGAQFPVSSRFAFPVVLALIVWVVYLFVGMKNQGVVGYFKNVAFPPGMPIGIYPLLTPIEILSTIIIRPATLAIRLFANMFAGHLLITVFTVSAWYLLNLTNFVGFVSVIGYLGSFVSFIVIILLTVFEMFIQALQAFIFTLLTAVFISSSLHAEH